MVRAHPSFESFLIWKALDPLWSGIIVAMVLNILERKFAYHAILRSPRLRLDSVAGN